MRKYIFNMDTATGGGASAMDGIDVADIRGDGTSKKLIDGSLCFIVGEVDGESKVYIARDVATPTANGDESILPIANSLGFEWQLTMHVDRSDGDMPSGYLVWSSDETVPAGFELYRRRNFVTDLLVTLAPWSGSFVWDTMVGLHADYLYMVDPGNAYACRYDLVLGGIDATIAQPPAAMSVTTSETVGTKIYIFDSANGVTRTYDMDTNLWGTAAVVPGNARNDLRSCVAGTKIYIGGGIEVVGSAFVRAIYEYDTVLDTYTYKADMPGVWESYGLAYNSDNSLVYIFTDSDPTDIVSFNPSTLVFDDTLSACPILLATITGSAHYNSTLGLCIGLDYYNTYGYDADTDTWAGNLPFNLFLWPGDYGTYYDIDSDTFYIVHEDSGMHLYRNKTIEVAKVRKI